MNLTVVIPHRDREAYKDFQKKYLPPYLKKQKINFQIVFVEQRNSKIFSRSKTINYGCLFAIKYTNPDYLIISDIDMVPLNVDYHYSNKAETWFMSAGGVVIKTEDFLKVNGYSNRYEGWGGEDSDFGLRLLTYNIPCSEWKKDNECEIVDLEMNTLESLDRSRGYFGYPEIQKHPRFYHPSEIEITSSVTTQYPKDWLTPGYKEKNSNMHKYLSTLNINARIEHFQNNGLNELDVENVKIDNYGNNITEVYWEI